MNVIIITSPDCPSCIKTKAFLNTNKIKFIEYKNTNDKAMQVFGNVVHSFPTVIVYKETGNGKANIIKYWGGYSKTKLDDLKE